MYDPANYLKDDTNDTYYEQAQKIVDRFRGYFFVKDIRFYKHIWRSETKVVNFWPSTENCWYIIAS